MEYTDKLQIQSGVWVALASRDYTIDWNFALEGFSKIPNLRS